MFQAYPALIMKSQDWCFGDPNPAKKNKGKPIKRRRVPADFLGDRFLAPSLFRHLLALHLEDHPHLVSTQYNPPCIRHEVWPFGRVTTPTPLRGRKLTMIANYLLNGIILQAPGASPCHENRAVVAEKSLLKFWALPGCLRAQAPCFFGILEGSSHDGRKWLICRW